MHIIDRLMAATVEKQNPTVLGLDTQFTHLPDESQRKILEEIGPGDGEADSLAYRTLAETRIASALLDYNKALIDALADVVPAVKLQIAYYELFGAPGVAVYEECIRYAKTAGLLVMADAKRNDIGATAEAYAAAFLGETVCGGLRFPAFDADFLTVNPYLGSDGIAPFVQACKAHNKGIFALVKTSNPSSGEFQDLKAEDGRPFYEHIGEKVRQWGEDSQGEQGYSRVGAVVGATYPEEAARLRQLLPHSYFLVPGYGAQGATAAELAPAFDKGGLGAIVNASRSIIAAHKKNPGLGPVDAALQEAQHMKAALLAALGGRIG